MKMLQKTLLNWYGGKFRLRRWILEHFAWYPHNIYVEPFGGGASVLLAKEPVQCEVYNDLDGRLVDLFKVMADPRQFKQFERIVSALPYSRKLFNDFRREIHTEKNAVKRAAMFFVIVRQSFAGTITGGWSYSKQNGNHRNKSASETWLNSIDALPIFHDRLRRVQIEQKDVVAVIDAFDTTDTLFYLDPPYVLETRSSPSSGYACEMTDIEHRVLVERLLTLKGSAVLSGYESAIYKPLLKRGWKIVRREVVCNAVGTTRLNGNDGVGGRRGHTRTECLYLSPTASQGEAANLKRK